MKKIISLICGLCFLIIPIVSGAVENKDEDEKKASGKVEVGAVVTNNSDYVGKVGEYIPLNEGVRPTASVSIIGILQKTFYEVISIYNGDSSNQSHKLSVNIGRIFDQKISYDSLPHRLDHDPLTNLDTVSEARSGVFHTDFNPNDEYKITRSEFLSQTKFFIPSVPFVKFFAHYRDEHRKGEYQARTLSKCSSCHVVAKSRPIDNHNRDYVLGSTVSIGGVRLDYSYTKRQFRENESAPTYTYLQKLHPELNVPVFNSRIQYDSADGALPFDEVPDIDKDTHLVKASVPITDSSTVSAFYLDSKVKNNATLLEIDSSSLAGGFSTRIGKRGVFNARVSHVKIDNDSVFVDVVEPINIAGPMVGKTFVQAYPGFGSADWERLSAMSRDTLDFDAILRYRFTPRLKLRLDYEYKKIDRDYFEVSNTKSHTFKGTIDYKPASEWKFQLSGRMKNTDNPFANLYTAVAPEVQSYRVTSPFAGKQFYEFHWAREAHLTNMPTDLSEVKGMITWNPSYRFSFNGSVLYRAQKNNELNFSVWENDTFNYGANFWYSAGSKTNFTGAYYFYGESLNSLFAMPVLEGCGGGIIGGFPGTLTDEVNYDVKTHTALFKMDYAASEKLSLYGSLSYNNSLAEMLDLSLDPNQLENIPNIPASPFEFGDISETVEYSDLSIKQLVGDIGFSYLFSEAMGINGKASYYFYDDLEIFLFDGSGKSAAFYLGFMYRF